MTNFETEFDRYYAEALAIFDRSGSTAEVYNYVSVIDDENYRDRTLGRVSCLLADKAQLDEALRFSSSISRPLERAHTLLDIGQVLLKRSALNETKAVLSQAAEVAEAIERAYDRAAVLLDIGSMLEIAAGKGKGVEFVRRAVELARPMPQDFEASKTLRACARTLAHWNLVSEAIEVAGAIDSQWSGLRQEAIDEVQGRGQWPVHPATDKAE